MKIVPPFEVLEAFRVSEHTKSGSRNSADGVSRNPREGKAGNNQERSHVGNEDSESELSSLVRTKPFETRASSRFIGLSLHQGCMPFVSLNGIYITFSPVLMAALVIVGVCALFFSPLNSVHSSSAFNVFGVVKSSGVATQASSSSLATSTAVPLPVLFPLLMLGLVFSQLAGTLLAGWFLAVAPQSLILSLTGVIDPELAQLQSEPKSASEGKKHKTPQGSKSLLHASDVQLRALGSSSGALLFLFGLYHSPLREILVSGSSISSYLWGYGAFLTISPFLPPHRMTESFKHGLREAALPLFVFLAISLLGATFAAQESPFLNSLSHSLSLEHLFLFALAVIGRQFWWSRLKLLSSFAQQITLRHAMIPMENVTCFSHGDTIEGAQLKALRSSQEIFPVLSGNRLTGVVQKEVLFRTSQQDEFDDEFISAIADPVRSYAAPDTMLEVCFGPEVHLPIFVLDDSELTGSEITGMVTAAQIRDSLLVALSGNRSFRSRNGLKDSQDSGTSE